MSFDPLTQDLQGTHAIEASAGTGKTYSITLLWLRLLIEQGLKVDQVLVTTFTRAATAELQERLLTSLRRALAAARGDGGSASDPAAKIIARMLPHLGTRHLAQELEMALSCFDLAPIHTIHGFCQSLINRQVLELGCDPGLELAEDAQEIIDELVGDELMRDAPRGSIEPAAARKMARCLARESAVPDSGILVPAVAGDPSPTAFAAARDQLLTWFPTLPQVLGTLRLGTSLEKTERIIRALAEGRQDEDLSAKASDKLQQERPDLAAAIRQMTSCLAAQRAQAIAGLPGLIRRDFPLRKSVANIRTFDDILLTVHQALHDQGDDAPLAKAVRERFRAAIVDECQDSDGMQIAVFRKLFSRVGSFLVIGDPKQSIYRFRGADLGSYQRLAGTAQKAPDMTVNHRSDGRLVAALNALYAPHPDFRSDTAAPPIRYQAVTAAQPAVRITDVRADAPLLLLWSTQTGRIAAKRDLAQQTAREFRRLLDEQVAINDRATDLVRSLKASDLAVLALNHGDLALVRRELQLVGIPCQQAGLSLGRVWTSDEALDVQAWLDAVHALEERSDPLRAMLAFAASPLMGMSAPELDGLRAAPARQAELAQRLLEDRDGLRHQGPLPLLQRYWTDAARLDSRLGSRDGERRLTNWRHLGCLLQEEWAAGRRRAGELSLWLARLRGEEDAIGEKTLMKLETDLPAVQLVTVFSAKGLEYPVVCCPFLWHVKSRQIRRQSPVALVRRPTGTCIDIGSEQFEAHLEEALAQEDAEQQRLLYVALTRARHRVYVGLAPVASGRGNHDNGAERSALAELLGLAQADKEQWPTLCPIPRLVLGVMPAASSPANSGLGGAEMQLAPAPAGPVHHGPLTRCSSYSALTRHEEAAARDHDPDDPADARRDAGLLADLGLGGNLLGTQVHALLEDILGNGRPLDEAVRGREPAWKEALAVILETPLPLSSARFALSEVQSHAIAEMHVLLPVDGLDPGRLSQALLCDPLIADDADRRAWAEGIARWDFSPLHGYFQGYIDLVCERDGRWYLIDYKTNALVRYDRPAVEAAMLDHHYVLQSRIYAVALHRHLRATMKEAYDPERSLGGCAYLFLRGFPEQGTWFERPGPVAIRALDDLFAKATP